MGLASALQLNTVRLDFPPMSPVINSLHFTQTLTTLDLKFNEIGDEGAMGLASALQLNTVRPDFPPMSPVIKSLHFTQTLTTLDLGRNNLGDKVMATLSNMEANIGRIIV